MLAARTSSSVSLRFFSDAQPGSLLAFGALVGVASVIFAGQALALSPVVPGPEGGAMVLAGMAASAAAAALPVAVLVGVLGAARAWREGGEFLALGAAGRPGRALLVPTLAFGLGAGGLEALLTHVVEPAGRGLGARALHGAAADLRLRPAMATTLGPVILHADGVDGRELREVFVAAPGVVAVAARGLLEGQGALVLEDGSARADGEGDWRVDFSRAEVSLLADGRRIELAERSTASLADLVGRMEARGRTADAERLALLKRSALPLTVPLLAVLGLALGARAGARMRPEVVATAVACGWWVVMRLCDQLAPQVGAATAASLPPLYVALAGLVAWLRWPGR